MVKAYCISKEGRYPKSNFCDVVPEELEKEDADIAVFQTGSREITNFDIQKAMMDADKDIKEYVEEWSTKVEEDSAKLFKLVVKVTEGKPKFKCNNSEKIGKI